MGWSRVWILVFGIACLWTLQSCLNSPDKGKPGATLILAASSDTVYVGSHIRLVGEISAPASGERDWEWLLNGVSHRKVRREGSVIRDSLLLGNAYPFLQAFQVTCRVSGSDGDSTSGTMTVFSRSPALARIFLNSQSSTIHPGGSAPLIASLSNPFLPPPSLSAIRPRAWAWKIGDSLVRQVLAPSAGLAEDTLILAHIPQRKEVIVTCEITGTNGNIWIDSIPIQMGDGRPTVRILLPGERGAIFAQAQTLHLQMEAFALAGRIVSRFWKLPGNPDWIETRFVDTALNIANLAGEVKVRARIVDDRQGDAEDSVSFFVSTAAQTSVSWQDFNRLWAGMARFLDGKLISFESSGWPYNRVYVYGSDLSLEREIPTNHKPIGSLFLQKSGLFFSIIANSQTEDWRLQTIDVNSGTSGESPPISGFASEIRGGLIHEETVHLLGRNEWYIYEISLNRWRTETTRINGTPSLMWSKEGKIHFIMERDLDDAYEHFYLDHPYSDPVKAGTISVPDLPGPAEFQPLDDDTLLVYAKPNNWVAPSKIWKYSLSKNTARLVSITRRAQRAPLVAGNRIYRPWTSSTLLETDFLR